MEKILFYLLLMLLIYFFKKYSFDKGLTIRFPDFFTPPQIDCIKVILKSKNIQNFNIINESTPIILFMIIWNIKFFFKEINNKKEINTGIEKKLFLMGHSKNIFILFYFKLIEFKVLDVMCLYYFGGRILIIK